MIDENQLIQHFAEQIDGLLQWLGTYGADAEGGVTRLLYSDAWLSAQHALAERMQSQGLAVRFDDAGNLFGRLQGTEPGAGVILTGSHVDTVIQGGLYDGAYGIAAGMAALSCLKERFGAPRRSVEVVAFAEEEGSRFPLTYWGSGNITGRYSAQNPPHVADPGGVTLQEAMQACGFGLGRHAVPALHEEVQAFVELHVEQGSVLETEGRMIGIVEGITGQRRFTVEVSGESNHAGTTPMALRRDALCGASGMILAIRDTALACGDPLRATVGKIEAKPGASNVIPGHVSFTLDARHPDAEQLDAYCQSVFRQMEQIAARQGLTLTYEPYTDAAPVPMDAGLTRQIELICGNRGLSWRRMYSGAGHDAQLFASRIPTAMVFVPSRSGISHSPEEYTEPERLAAGVLVLADLLHALAY